MTLLRRRGFGTTFGTGLGTLARLALVGGGAGLLAACNDGGGLNNSRAYQAIAPQTLALMAEKGTSKQAPMLIRTYKKEAEFEIWKMGSDGRYALLKTYPMCRWSGQLGPKVKEGDRQVPEGFYAITPGQMNPNSAYYLSFNVGYPNAYDRAHGASGGAIMVHGACSSAGCFSMTDQQIAEIYAVARESFAGGQREIQMESFPFRMTPENFAKHRADPNIAFWKQLKEGADNFEVTKLEPAVGVCGRRYVFNATPANPGQRLEAEQACPPLKQDTEIASLVSVKQHQDETKIAELAASGVKAVRVVYADGGQHPDFFSKMSEVSRPDAIAQGPVEIDLADPKLAKSPALQIAGVKAAKGGTTIVAASAGSSPTATIPTPNAAAAPAVPSPSAMQAAPSHLFGLFGASEAAKPAAVETQEPAVPQPVNVPLPPKRSAGAAAAPRPQASLEPAPKNAAAGLAKLIEGSLPALPDGFLAYAPISR
ncbi:MAG: murein L,D-transpeptidase [Beijerinckiaceae bacterium]